MSSQKGARSKLADVLADIKNSRTGDEHNSGIHETPPAPKRRNAVNYVALSGHTPRASRSSNSANANSASAANSKSSISGHKQSNTTSAEASRTHEHRPRTYILRLFDRTVDLAQFTGEKGRSEGTPLYPVCRAWVHDNNPKLSRTNQSTKSPIRQQIVVKVEKETPEVNPNPSCQQQEQATPNELVANDVHSLPPPKTKLETMQQLNLTPENDADIRIPKSVRDYEAPKDVEKVIDESIESMTLAECMESNMKRWKRVREEWKEARKIHETRYEDSFKVLESLCVETCTK